MADTRRTKATTDRDETSSARNDVVLRGRLPAAAEERALPSGDLIVTLRIVVPRRGGPARPRRSTGASRATVDTIDVVCWTAATRRAAMRLEPGDTIEVEGSLRRRFFGGGTGRQSRYDVEAGAVRRLSGGARSGS